MLGGQIVLMLAKRWRTSQMLIVALSQQHHVCPVFPPDGDNCLVYTSDRCAFVSKFSVVHDREESASGLQHQIMLNFLLPCQSLHVLRCTVLAAVRCVYEQTLQAYSPVCPGKVPREHIHLAHMLAPHWLFGLLCLHYKISSLFCNLFFFSVTSNNW